MTKLFRAVALTMVGLAVPAGAQVWDRTGNGLLSGAYGFRELINLPDAAGNATRLITFYGTITFDGRGTYAITGNAVDTGGGSGAYNTTGTYSLSASGYGFLKHPLTYGAPNGSLFGSVSNGVFIGSATENQINDFFVAVPLGSPSNSTFSGLYSMAYLNFPPTGSAASTYDSMALLDVNGAGSVANVPVKTYLAQTTATVPAPVNQTENSVTYSFTSGVGKLRFPTTTNLAIQGDKVFYITPDGNFFIGGSATGFDFMLGVRRPSVAGNFEGLYYQGGFNQGPSSVDTYYGSINVRGGTLWEHQRYLSTISGIPANYTAIGHSPGATTIDYTDDASDVEYVVGTDGAIRIGIGRSPYLGIRVAVRAPKFTGEDPYIDPTGVLNSASFAPFTAGVARGELLTIFGSGLASKLTVAPTVPFPDSLGGVQVLMNNRRAAIYYVSPTQVSAIVPYGITDGIVQIQIIKDNLPSNTVTAFMYTTNPGIFSLSQNGDGSAAALHANYQVITNDNPARPGEAVLVFLTGLGDVTPTIADGAPGPTRTLAEAVNSIGAYVDNLQATIGFAGLAPTLSGLYQVNLSVPDKVSIGEVFLDIAGPDSYTSQVKIAVAAAASDPVVPRKASVPVHRR
ncbi:MAG: hypothetical protein ABI811_08625 [Acidobacteriota bacterium]